MSVLILKILGHYFLIFTFIYLFYLVTLSLSCSMWDLFSDQGSNLGPLVLGVWSFNHWTARDICPLGCYYFKYFLCFILDSFSSLVVPIMCILDLLKLSQFLDVLVFLWFFTFSLCISVWEVSSGIIFKLNDSFPVTLSPLMGTSKAFFHSLQCIWSLIFLFLSWSFHLST